MHRLHVFVRRTVWVSALFLALSVVSGCGGGGGPDLGYVKGVVTLDEKPLPKAQLVFQPLAEEGSPSSATTDENGHYELKYTMSKEGAMVGDHIVRITTGGMQLDENDSEVRVPEKVPARYNAKAQENPEMKKKVEAGSQTIDFKLTSEGEIIQPNEDGE
jgi:hypothetical protein